MASTQDQDVTGLNVLSNRFYDVVKSKNLLLEAFQIWAKNPYDAETNPNGTINLNTSENKIVFDILEPKLNNDLKITEEMTHYGDLLGREYFRAPLAKFLTKYFKASRPILKEELACFSGLGSSINVLASVLCDAEEYVLVPSPYYGSFHSDMGDLSQVRIFPVKLTSELQGNESTSEPFELTIPRLEKALQEAESEGKRVRCLIICNPVNPFGTFFTESAIKDYLDFAYRHELHILFDEIYHLSVHARNANVVSVLSLLNHLPDPNRTHFIWGFSKDFAVSGLRAAVLWTQNKAFLNSAFRYCYLCAVAPPVQKVLGAMITDYEWLDNVYLPTMRGRLRKACEIVTRTFDDMSIRYVEPKAGFFLWFDLIEFMSSADVDGETKLWFHLIEKGVCILPGRGFHCSEVGWFRLIFSSDTETLSIAMQRLRKCLPELRNKEHANLSAEQRAVEK